MYINSKETLAALEKEIEHWPALIKEQVFKTVESVINQQKTYPVAKQGVWEYAFVKDCVMHRCSSCGGLFMGYPPPCSFERYCKDCGSKNTPEEYI